MDFTESTSVVFNRIKKLAPEHVTKIIGYLLLQEDGDQKMIHLATSPDTVIQEVIYKAKAELQNLQHLALKSPVSPTLNSVQIPELPPLFTQLSPVSHFPSPNFGGRMSQFGWEPQNSRNQGFRPLSYSNAISELQNHAQLLRLEDQVEPVNMGNTCFSNDYCYPDAALGVLGSRTHRRCQNMSEFPVKTCHYFNKGFCKHGNNCRFFHGQISSDSISQLFAHNSDDDHVFPSASLEKLELEIVELLKSRRGNPVSIASLPMLYYEKYGKAFQAEGYLTESQRHGKAGYSLTKLLARWRNSVRLIERPHGQHAIILAEDAPKYTENLLNTTASGARQIYLTFPAESTFTEDDVSNHFNIFGQVEDVRIPCQQNRMFGFVTFASADTVKTILAKGNPHFVCGARVLVKPYREKSKLVDRKQQQERTELFHCPPHYPDIDPERPSRGPRLIRHQLLEEGENLLDHQMRRFVGNHFARKPLENQYYFGSMDGSQVSEDHLNFLSEEHYNELLDVLNSDDNLKHVKTTKHTHLQESEGLNLPDSLLE